MKKKKLAIATLQGVNYGSRLQNYALQTVLEKNANCEVESLWYVKRKNPLYANNFSRCRQYTIFEIICVFLKLCLENIFSKRITKEIENRYKLFDEFISEYIHRTEFQQIADRNTWQEKYDMLICGSDQIWNPNVIDEVYVGEGMGIKHIISYAASIGRGYLSEYESKYIVERIEKMDAISVRESSAKTILENAGLKKHVEVVVDPTMLLTQEDWDYVAAKRIIKEPYVFIYSFSNCKFKQDIVDFFAAKNIKVYFIPYAKRVWNAYDGKSPMESLFDVGPKEFLSLIKHAEMVFTDSFHGAVLSIIFNKAFYVFERNKEEKTSMNSRLSDLLATFNLSSRKINIFPSDVYQKIDYEKVNAIVAEQRQKSLQWLIERIQNDTVIE